MAAPRSDTQLLLAAVRKGDGIALLALMDHLQETGKYPKILAYWQRAVRGMTWFCRQHNRGRKRIGPHEMASRWAWNLLRRMHRLKLLGRMRDWHEFAYVASPKLASALVRHVRSIILSEVEIE